MVFDSRRRLVAPPPLPAARGTLSDSVITALRRRPGAVTLPSLDDVDMLTDDDAQLALTCCYELHYRSFAGVDDGWEWEPALLDFRRGLELAFEQRLVDEVGWPHVSVFTDVVGKVRALAANDDGPSLSQHIVEAGSREELREFCVHRSTYHLKEADPHTWAVPRLYGRAKAAMVEIQYDEYGAGDVRAMHAELFADTMAALDLRPAYGAYLDLLPGTTLATGNLVTMFGLHRRWRGACVGHLALFEMTSVRPMARYGDALCRIGLPKPARRFYEAHVEADAIHAVVAQESMVAGLLDDEPDLAGDVLFGAGALIEVERRFAAHLLQSWSAGRTSLLQPLASFRGGRRRSRATAARVVSAP